MKVTLGFFMLGFATFLLLGQVGTGSRPSSLQYGFVPGCAPNQLWCFTALAAGRVDTQAAKMLREGSTLRMTGQVKISTSVIGLTAAGQVYHFNHNAIAA